MGSTASFEISCGFCVEKRYIGSVESYERGKTYIFFFKSEKLFVRKQKAFNCFPPKGFYSQT